MHFIHEKAMEATVNLTKSFGDVTDDAIGADEVLNDDVLLEILKYLNVMDIISYRQVCSRFESNADNHLARKCKHFHIDPSLDHKAKEIVRNLGPHLKTLHLVSVHSLKQADKLLRQMQSIAKHCKQLMSLTIETRNWYGAIPLITSQMNKMHFEHLKYLELHNIKMDKELDMAALFPQVQTLKLDSITNFTGQTLLGLDHLEVVYLNSCAQLRPNFLYDFFKAKGTALRQIVMHKCREVDEIILNEIVANLPNIESVSLKFSYSASFDPSTLHCLQNLKSLSLHNFQTYDVNGFIKLLATGNRLERWEINGENFKIYQLDGSAIDKLERSTNLTELKFVNCNFISDELLYNLGRNLNLQKFSIQDCWGFSANGLMQFVRFSKRLTNLSIRNCTILRSATIDIANMVLEDDERPAIHIDYDIDCGHRPFTCDFYDDEDEQYYPFDGYCDSDSSDIEL